MVPPEACQGEMPRVRRAPADLPPTRIVPGPDPPRVAGEPLRGREVKERLVVPETARAAEGRDPRLGRDAGPGQRRDAATAPQQIPETRRDRGHPFSPARTRPAMPAAPFETRQ